MKIRENVSTNQNPVRKLSPRPTTQQVKNIPRPTTPTRQQSKVHPLAATRSRLSRKLRPTEARLRRLVQQSLLGHQFKAQAIQTIAPTDTAYHVFHPDTGIKETIDTLRKGPDKHFSQQ